MDVIASRGQGRAVLAMTSSGMPSWATARTAAGKLKAYTYLDPARCARSTPSACHQRGVDIYPGDFRTPALHQTWGQWFAKDMRSSSAISYPGSLEGWAKHVKDRGQVLSIGEFGVMGRADTDFLKGMFDRLTVLSKTQPVGYVLYFHQADSKLVGRPGQEANVAMFKATFGSLA
jgi:hypothetical protein